jgi:hypothetical protein
MKRLNSVIYNKLMVQAEEAKIQGMEKLAHNILGAICGSPDDEAIQYSIGEMQEEVHHELWKLASHILKYYDTKINPNNLGILLKFYSRTYNFFVVEKGMGQIF